MYNFIADAYDASDLDPDLTDEQTDLDPFFDRVARDWTAEVRAELGEAA